MIVTMKLMKNIKLTMMVIIMTQTVAAYISALESPQTPTVISLSRQAVPTLEGSCPEKVKCNFITE